MMKIKKPQSEDFLEIYSARLTFTKKENGQVSKDMVRVTIRYGKKRRIRIKDLQIPNDPEDPDYIDIGNLDWKKYMGKGIATYHRRSKNQDYDYTSGGVTISTNLGQRLEDLVKKVCFGNSDKTEHIK